MDYNEDKYYVAHSDRLCDGYEAVKREYVLDHQPTDSDPEPEMIPFPATPGDVSTWRVAEAA